MRVYLPMKLYAVVKKKDNSIYVLTWNSLKKILSEQGADHCEYHSTLCREKALEDIQPIDNCHIWGRTEWLESQGRNETYSQWYNIQYLCVIWDYTDDLNIKKIIYKQRIKAKIRRRGGRRNLDLGSPTQNALLGL